MLPEPASPPSRLSQLRQALSDFDADDVADTGELTGAAVACRNDRQTPSRLLRSEAPPSTASSLRPRESPLLYRSSRSTMKPRRNPPIRSLIATPKKEDHHRHRRSSGIDDIEQKPDDAYHDTLNVAAVVTLRSSLKRRSKSGGLPLCTTLFLLLSSTVETAPNARAVYHTIGEIIEPWPNLCLSNAHNLRL